jgi:hypothetical protein
MDLPIDKLFVSLLEINITGKGEKNLLEEARKFYGKRRRKCTPCLKEATTTAPKTSCLSLVICQVGHRT